jgi:hypothetical protein
MGGRLVMVSADASSLWLLVTLVILAISVVGLGINANIRRSRDTSMRQAEGLQEEVRRLRAEQAKVKLEQERAAQDEAGLRRRALEEALRREPDLRHAKDEAAVARLTALVDQIVQEFSIRQELDEVKATEAERARLAELAREAEIRKAEERKRQQATRDAEKAKRREEARLRQEYLESLPSWRRWIEEHKSLVVVSAALIGVTALGASIAVAVTVAQTRQAEEQAKEAREEQERLEVEAAANEKAEQEFQATLPTACDLSIDKNRIPPEVWVTWLQCEDLNVVTEASLWLMDEAEILFRRQNYNQIQQALKRVVKRSGDAELISRISTHPGIDRAIHKEIVGRWGPDVAGPSFIAFYEQQCSDGVRPAEYVANSSWIDQQGGTVLFDGQNCNTSGFNVQALGRGNDVISSLPRLWSQVRDKVTIRPYIYNLVGDRLEFSPEATGRHLGKPPPVLIRAE